MRIFVDAHYLEVGSNGVGSFILYLYRELISNNRLYTFVFGAYNVDKIKKYFKEYENVIFVKYLFNNQIRFIYDIPKIIQNENINIAHFQYLIPVIKNKNTIYINTIHDLLFIEYKEYFPIFYRILRKVLFYISSRRADIITTVSEYSKESLNKYFKIKNEKIHTIPLGVNKNYNTKEPIQKEIVHNIEGKKYILYVSRFEPRKKQELLLQTYLDLKLYKDDIFLVFVGYKSIKNEKFENIYKTIDKNLLKYIYIYQKINNSTLNFLYENCLLFVYLSIAEGFGLPILEASVKKKQVILVNSTAMKDFLFLKKGYIKIDKNNNIDMDSLKEKIKLALENKLYSNKELEEIKNIVLENYNWEKVAHRFEALIKDVL